MGSLRHQAIEHVGFGVAGYGIWLLWAIVFALAASASGHLISPNAEGSGIPQMKSILSGTMMTRYLTVRVLIAKVTGVISALVAGLSVGKEVRDPPPAMHACCRPQATAVPHSFASTETPPTRASLTISLLQRCTSTGAIRTCSSHYRFQALAAPWFQQHPQQRILAPPNAGRRRRCRCHSCVRGTGWRRPIQYRSDSNVLHGQVGTLPFSAADRILSALAARRVLYLSRGWTARCCLVIVADCTCCPPPSVLASQQSLARLRVLRVLCLHF